MMRVRNWRIDSAANPCGFDNMTMSDDKDIVSDGDVSTGGSLPTAPIGGIAVSVTPVEPWPESGL
jgi:hypothetical protein